MSRAADLGLGLGAIALAGGYGAMAAAIPKSLLSDAVGPGGVPLVIAGLMGLAGTGLLLRATLAGRTDAREPPDHVRAAGLLGLLVVYVAAIPHVGYPIAIGALAAAVAWFAGARGWSVAAFAVGLALLFWGGFVLLLGIPFPAGRLFGGY
ncbi:tripartite tricarboxylate transporter TctB family protein [Elioraea rosea]|uniref:tripartite tricarboxylate transporter TctB family protein n=1 Tax=Elioraea rosea TaxID=2492390 RepID=UPI001182DAEE|nr:tripartite tricarboxylate transporter TctB family protein [Elioraea rosea]